MTLLSLYFALAIGISFICSINESVLLSLSPAYLGVEAKKGHRFARIFQNFRRNIDRPLAAILTINTVANTLGATLVGAQTLTVFGDESLAIASVLLTVSILVLSEILPKTLGALYARQLAPLSAFFIETMVVITYPVVSLAMLVSQFFTKKASPKMTREEVIETAELGVSEGALKIKESRVISNLLMLDKILVKDIMTPKSVLLAVEESETVRNILRKHRPLRYSRIPIYRGDVNKIVGLTHRYKLLEASASDYHETPVKNLSSPIDRIQESLTVASALDLFVRQNTHIFLVVNKENETQGIVSLEDAIETLLGVEIVDEYDQVADLRAYAKEQLAARKLQGKK